MSELITHEDMERARLEFGTNSQEYLRTIRAFRSQERAAGRSNAGPRPKPRPKQEVSVVATEREIRHAIEDAIRKGDSMRLRELARITIAKQLLSKDPKLARDAGKAILNDIKVDDDDDVTVVEYLTPAAPGWADFPPADFFLPDEDAVEVTAATD